MIFSTLMTFMIYGFVLHDIFGVVFEQVIGLQNTCTFFFFGVFTLKRRFLEKDMKQDLWPASINLVVNALWI